MAVSFADRLKQKIIVFDGAMGTNIQRQNLTPDDFQGYDGCNEYLVLSKPKAILSIHEAFLAVGCDVVETDTFGSNAVVLSEYGLAGLAYQLNKTAAELARTAADAFSTPAWPRYVAGSIGPGTRLPSLAQISYKELYEAFYIQSAGLLDGGADLFIVETVQDILQAKAALNAVRKLMEDRQRRLPLMLSVTMETNGTMLLGTDMMAALAAFSRFPIDIFGLNCATGPEAMLPHVQTLAKNSPFPISVIPNAGLPKNTNGHLHYDLTPDHLAGELHHFINDLNTSVVGGCCGTTPDHLRAVVERAAQANPPHHPVSAFQPAAGSLYNYSGFEQSPKPFIIGERTNANGSKLFREALLKNDLEAMTEIARSQEAEGVHAIDVSLAYVNRNESEDYARFIPLINQHITVPVMIDSTSTEAIETALQKISGRAIVNSINLEDGEERALEIIRLCRTYGAALVALTIDEQGMAQTAERKTAIARRLIELAEAHGLHRSDLFIDTLTFTLASGDPVYRRSAQETLSAIRMIKTAFPGVFTILGVSNVSFGLKPDIRPILNSVFLQEAVSAGLDAAILHAGKILPLHSIPVNEIKMMGRLIADNQHGSDPLTEILAYYETHTDTVKTAVSLVPADLPSRLVNRIINGQSHQIETDLQEALGQYSALEIINTFLLEGMRQVGELFGRGEMQLPFVLKSAETMKKSVNFLESFMSKTEQTNRGVLLIGTVRGDVHDIGKNLVDIILTNNGYRVINLGIKIPVEQFIEALEKEPVQAVGMSGLLVKSTQVMRENLSVFRSRGIRLPVILGGAALNRSFVEDLKKEYDGPLFYAKDAFDGLKIMQNLEQAIPDRAGSRKIGREKKTRPAGTVYKARPVEIPAAPFWGWKTEKSLSAEALFEWINPIALFRAQWGFKNKIPLRQIEPVFEDLMRQALAENRLQPAVIYGYFPCQSEGDILHIFNSDKETAPAVSITFPRQQKSRGRCIADFFRSVDTGTRDVIGLQMVTAGEPVSEFIKTLYKADRYQDYLYWHGLSVEFTEGLAEYWHSKMRRQMGIHQEDAGQISQLFRQKYRGSRYSFGYPACPDLEQQDIFFKLMKPEEIGIQLSETWQLVPEQSTSAIIVHHPEAKYFNI